MTQSKVALGQGNVGGSLHCHVVLETLGAITSASGVHEDRDQHEPSDAGDPAGRDRLLETTAVDGRGQVEAGAVRAGAEHHRVVPGHPLRDRLGSVPDEVSEARVGRRSLALPRPARASGACPRPRALRRPGARRGGDRLRRQRRSERPASSGRSDQSSCPWAGPPSRLLLPDAIPRTQSRIDSSMSSDPSAPVGDDVGRALGLRSGFASDGPTFPITSSRCSAVPPGRSTASDRERCW